MVPVAPHAGLYCLTMPVDEAGMRRTHLAGRLMLGMETPGLRRPCRSMGSITRPPPSRLFLL